MKSEGRPRRGSEKFRSDFSLNYRLSTVTEVTRHNRIPQFRAASRTPNNSTRPLRERRPTFDPDKASFAEARNVRSALLTPQRRLSPLSFELFGKENILRSSTRSTGAYRYRGERRTRKSRRRSSRSLARPGLLLYSCYCYLCDRYYYIFLCCAGFFSRFYSHIESRAFFFSFFSTLSVIFLLLYTL